jgi:hypothetical protein
LHALGLHPSHGCGHCGTEFIASDRIYRREVGNDEIIGIGVWPHGRRPVRVEDHDQGWTIVVAGEGSMLVYGEAGPLFFAEVFEGIGPWEVEGWARRRGFEAIIEQSEEGTWEVGIHDPYRVFGLTLVKTWWRALGKDPVAKALERLGGDVVWLAHDTRLDDQGP